MRPRTAAARAWAATRVLARRVYASRRGGSWGEYPRESCVIGE